MLKIDFVLNSLEVVFPYSILPGENLYLKHLMLLYHCEFIAITHPRSRNQCGKRENLNNELLILNNECLNLKDVDLSSKIQTLFWVSRGGRN